MMSDSGFVRSRGRQRRSALQKSVSSAVETVADKSQYEVSSASEVSEYIPLEETKTEVRQPEDQIEIVAEVLTDISADIKEELKRKKKKRLKELKSGSQKHLNSVYELDVINKDEGILEASPDHTDHTKLLPKTFYEIPGFDNDGWCADEHIDTLDDLDTGQHSLYQKLSPLSVQSPARVARRQKLVTPKNDRLQETIINILPEKQNGYNKNDEVRRKHRTKRRQEKVAKEKATSSLSYSSSQYDVTDSCETVADEEAYDFLSRAWDNEEPELSTTRSHATPTEQEIPQIVVSEEHQEDTAILISHDYFGKNAELFVTFHTKPVYVPFEERSAKEMNLLFRPSYEPVSWEKKFPNSAQQHNFVETESISRRIIMRQRNINVLENRLLKAKLLHWFGDDGTIKTLADPTANFLPDDFTIEEQEKSYVMYAKAHNITSRQRLSEGKKYELELDISSLVFSHHPLFGREHVVVSQLLQIYEKYISSIQTDAVGALKHKLATLRKMVLKLKQAEKLKTTLSEKRSSGNLPEVATRLKALNEEIRQTRKMRDVKEGAQRTLLEKMQGVWNELKSLRESQGFNSTSVKLEITEEEQDEAKDMEEFEKEVEQEFQAEKEEVESQYKKALLDYNSAMAKWKKWNKAKKQATKRQKRQDTSKSQGQNSQTEFGELDEDEQAFSEEEEPEKPQSPKKFESKKAFERLMQNALKMRRNPGAPKVKVKLEFNVSVTPTDECPKSEIQRRVDVSKTQLHFRIIFNDKQVSETTYKNLSQEFHAFWGQIFKLRIVHFPLSFKLEIYESGIAKRKQIAEVYLPIPDITQTSSASSLVNHHFSSDQMENYAHSAVGSGVLFDFANGDRSWLLTSGSVRCSLVWVVTEDGTVLAPPKAEERTSVLSTLKKSHPMHLFFSGNFTTLAEIREEIQKMYIDPGDPTSTDVFQVIQDYRIEKDNDVVEMADDYFRLDPLNDPFEFVTTEELENNNRFRMLQLRNTPEFKNLEIAPSEQEMSSDIMEQWQRKYSDPSLRSDSEIQTHQAHKLRQKVRKEVAKRFYLQQHQKTLDDLVIEEKVPNIGTLGFGLLKLFQRKRPLYPVRKERKKVTGQAAINSEVKIMVTVLHAVNVPVRTDVDPVKERVKKQGSQLHDLEDDYESQVRPFVEVMFQRVASKTTVADGPYPTWNQELHLPFRAENGDFSPQNLERVNDVIYFNLFDEVTVDLLEDDKDRESVVHQRLERRWLGNLKIPFSTLYLNSKIEGTFQVNMPPVLLGYKNEPHPWLIGSSDGNTSVNTHLSLFITIEPCLQLPEVFREKCDSGEPEKVLREVEKWHQNVIPRYPDRLIKVITVDLAGQWIFVSRFLRSISPPEELMHHGKDSLETWETLCRFVSMIPTVADSVAYPGICDIWSTSDQFLQMLTGDQEEHSILLCSFFLHLGKKAMLLLGHGIPEGPTAYVITWEPEGDVWVWNASIGCHFSTRDSHSPLQRVGCIISPDNVWMNIQRNDHPSRVNFDLSKTDDWKPFFHRGFPNPGLKSVQPASLTYKSTDPEFVKELEDALKRNLQENIMKWRRRHCTSWNSYCNQVLYKILRRLERNAGQTASMDSLQELEQILSSHKMIGFPLVMPYTDMDAVIEAVFATGVHITEDKNAEFSLAVYLHPYPCSVMAVWVYVAVLISRRGSEIE